MWGFLTLAQVPLYVKAVERIWPSILGFQQYLYAHLYFAFRSMSIGSNFYVLPTHTLMHDPFIAVFSFGGVSFCFVCTICIIVQPVMSYLEVHLLCTDK